MVRLWIAIYILIIVVAIIICTLIIVYDEPVLTPSHPDTSELEIRLTELEKDFKLWKEATETKYEE